MCPSQLVTGKNVHSGLKTLLPKFVQLAIDRLVVVSEKQVFVYGEKTNNNLILREAKPILWFLTTFNCKNVRDSAPDGRNCDEFWKNWVRSPRNMLASRNVSYSRWTDFWWLGSYLNQIIEMSFLSSNFSIDPLIWKFQRAVLQEKKEKEKRQIHMANFCLFGRSVFVPKERKGLKYFSIV